MLSNLSMNNVALFKKQDVEFMSGFNCLLGQSGAGKSIIIDALSFVMGQKASKNLVRSFENSMRVDAVFSDVSKEVLDFLKSEDIDVEDELIVTRTYNIDGKSSIKLNGFPITLKTLQNLSEILVDFCGQHDSVGLLKVSNHLQILDDFGGEEIFSKRDFVKEKYNELKSIEREIASYGGDENERARKKDLLQFQIDEIESAKLVAGEDVELKERLEFISSSEKIFENVSEAVSRLDSGKDGATGAIYSAKNLLSNISNFKDIEQCHQRLESAYYEIRDVAETLNDIKASTDFDPNELERIEDRLDVLKKLSRKYGKTIEELIVYVDECKNQLDSLENGEFMLEKLETKRVAVQKELSKASVELSDLRKKYAEKLENQIVFELSDLEMKGTYFKVNFEHSDFSSKGCDSVKFMFSANKGQEIKDIDKTASGGELSRLMLAFKNIMLGKEDVQTIVFDEIDAGISGVTAGKVAQKIENISKYTQVICITHTPVVASKANAFVLVEKFVEDGQTYSKVRPLDREQSIYEIARLIDGGENVSQTAIEHAKNLI